MKSKEVILKTLRKELPYLKEEYNVKSIGIFGSYVRSEQKEESDVDILVEFQRPVGFFHFLKLEDYLSERLGLKVDLVTSDALKPIIKPRILKEVVYA
ncbi:MAG: nucleotidyltransferase family protein [Promethearchaeota archaeon]